MKKFAVGVLDSSFSLKNKSWEEKTHEALLENGFEIISEKKSPKNIWKKSHIILFEDCPTAEVLEKCKKNKVVPIVPQGCGMTNFQAVEETGNAFTYEKNNFWQFLGAIFRASVNFEFAYDWNTLKKNLVKK